EHLNGKNVCRAKNAPARQRFGPLQDLEFLIFFWGVRWRAGITAQEGFSNAFTADFPIAAAIRTEPLLPSAALDFAPTASAGYRRVTSRGAHDRPRRGRGCASQNSILVRAKRRRLAETSQRRLFGRS